MNERISVFVAGVQKGGTTSLFAHFCDHPSLSQPSVKELHFFDDENQNWERPAYGSIERYFSPQTGAISRFEATPIYIFWPPSIPRIKSYNREARLIFLFRDPFDRAWSQWCHQYELGYEPLAFAEAIRAGRLRMLEHPPLTMPHRLFSYIERGLYAGQVERVLAHFPIRQVLFLRSEDLMQDHRGTLERIANFLEIAPFPNTGPKHENRQPNISFPSVPNEDDLELVANLVANDVCRFSRLTGIDVSRWKVVCRRSPTES